MTAAVATTVADVTNPAASSTQTGHTVEQETADTAAMNTDGHAMNEHFYTYRHLLEQAMVNSPSLNHPNQEWIAIGGFHPLAWGCRGVQPWGCGCGGMGCGACGFRRHWW